MTKHNPASRVSTPLPLVAYVWPEPDGMRAFEVQAVQSASGRIAFESFHGRTSSSDLSQSFVRGFASRLGASIRLHLHAPPKGGAQ